MATWRSTEELRSDPWVVDRIARAVAEYEGVLLPEELAWMTDQFFEMLAGDADAAEVLRLAHPKIGDESGDVPRRSSPAEAEEQTTRGAKDRGSKG